LFYIRRATSSDLPGILKVEESWPKDSRAEEDKFLARLERFGEGFFIACVKNENHEDVIATLTAMPLNYKPEQISEMHTWDQVTNRGYLHPSKPISFNALYIVSGVVDRKHRGAYANLFQAGILSEVELAHKLNLKFVVAGAVLPGYAKFCESHSEIPIAEYCHLRKGQHLIDPLLAMYESIHFHLPDDRHIISEYYPDDASKNYAAILVRDVEKYPLSTSN
jgi:hypothetical protein